MKNTNIELSVIIVSYNCLSYLKNCINSIEKYNDIGNKLEVIVVDNSNNNQTINWLNVEKPDIIAIKNNNKGFGQGNNVGAKIAKGKYLLFLNPDTLLVEKIFAFAIEKFKNNPNLGCFGLQLLDKENKKTLSYCLRMPALGFKYRIIARLFNIFDCFIPSLMYTSGADIFIDKETFIKIGMFDEKIFMYREEPDLCNRINKYGKTLAFFKEKSIIHLEGKASNFDEVSKKGKILKSVAFYCYKYNINLMKLLKEECFILSIKYYLYKHFSPNINKKMIKDLISIYKKAYMNLKFSNL